MKKIILSFLALTLSSVISACAHAPQNAGEAEALKLNNIVTEFTESSKHLDPFSATYFNVEEDLDKFGDYPTPAYHERSKNIYVTALRELKDVNPILLPEKDRQTYRLFKEDMEVSLKGFDFPEELLDFNQMGSRLRAYLDDSSPALTSFPFDSVKHYEDFVKRSEGFPIYIDNQIALLRRGIKENIVLSCVTAKAAVNSYSEGLEPNAEKNPFYRPVLAMPDTFSADDKARLQKEFHQMVLERIVPGFQKFDHFFRTEYTPHCRAEFGIGKLPHGKEWYAYDILANTNLALDPKEVHKLGLAEVKRIQAEIEQVKKEMGFKGSFKAFLKSLKKDPRYFFTSRDEMFNAFLAVKEKTAQVVPNYFSLTPTHDYKIVETSNPEDAAGQYYGPTENIPYGRFVVNTINLRSVPKYDVTTLSLHETVPGHHYQIALQFEMKDKLSEYQRKIYSSNSFVEGWALYSEYLGREMGMYKDPMQRLGNLNDEMLRAVRLVVDTGIHAYGWSQKRVLQYMNDHLADDEKGISNEASRYSVWPGQALGYKIGQLKIIELRHLAEKELGPKFDLKEFHRVVIGNGTVSLGILETQVRDWIASVKARGQG